MNAVEKFQAMRDANAQALTNFGKMAEGIKPLTDRDKVGILLKQLEYDDTDIARVFAQCADDPEARKYWVGRYDTELETA